MCKKMWGGFESRYSKCYITFYARLPKTSPSIYLHGGWHTHTHNLYFQISIYPRYQQRKRLFFSFKATITMVRFIGWLDLDQTAFFYHNSSIEKTNVPVKADASFKPVCWSWLLQVFLSAGAAPLSVPPISDQLHQPFAHVGEWKQLLSPGSYDAVRPV